MKYRQSPGLVLSTLTVLVLSSLVLTPLLPAQGIITTVAGTTWVFRGDGNLAKSVPLGATGGICADSVGNLYATDHDNNLVLKILPSGALQVVAGNGLLGFSGDGGPATSAELFLDLEIMDATVSHLAVDASGNLYIADTLSNRIRKVSPDGIIRTVAGAGSPGFAGDGRSATSAYLNSPTGVAVDAAGSLYIADKDNHRVRKVDSAGIITTVAGDGFGQFGEGRFSGDGGPAIRASLNYPRAVAVDAAGNLYIADNYNHVIRKVSAAGTITTVAGQCDPDFTWFFGGGFSGDGGPATKADLNFPTAVVLDAAENMYIADAGNDRVRKVGTNGVINTVAGNGASVNGFRRFSGDGGPAAAATLSSPVSVAVDAAGNLYISDSEHGRLRKVTTDGIINTVAGNGRKGFSGDGGPATNASLNGPGDAAVDAAGNLYIADSGNHRIRRITSGGIINTVAGNGDRTYSGDGGPATEAALAFPTDVATDAAGNLLIADARNYRVRRVTAAGTISTVAGTGTSGFSGDGGPATDAALSSPVGVGVNQAGNLYIADSANFRIRKVTSGGTISTVAGTGASGFSGDGGPATSASVAFPSGVAADATGNLYIADSGNQRIRQVNSTGTISTVAGNGTRGFSGDGGSALSASMNMLPQPDGGGGSPLAVDGSGSIYVADTSNHRIRKFGPGGTISTVAGNGQAGFSGDGGAATTAALLSPQSVALDAAGNLYIADTGNGRIRKVLAAAPLFAVSPISLSFSAPAGAPVVAPQLAAVTSTVGGLVWGASVSAPWLSVSPAAGTAPGLLSVGVNVSSLSPGTYSGTVTVQAPLAANPLQTVQVQLTVVAASDARPDVDNTSVTFETATAAANPAPRAFRIRNAGGGTLDWTARAQTLNGGNWLGISPTSGAATAANPAAIQVSTTAAGMQPGLYSGIITIESPQARDPVAVSVDLIVSQVTQTVALTQTAMNFAAAEGDMADLKQPLGIVNTGQGTMNWTARAKTMDGGNWLRLSASSGQSEAGSVIVSTTDVTVNPTGLRAGMYAALVQVDAPGANNSPRLVIVTLQVRAAGSRTAVQLQPQALIFSARAGGGSPSSQNTAMTTGSAAGVEARGAVLTPSGGEWLKVLPTNLVVSSSDPRSIVVQPVVDKLAAGEYRGTLTFQFSDNSTPQAVEVYFLVVGNPVQTAASVASDGLAAAGCARQKIVAVSRTLAANFAASVGTAQPLEIQVMDDCGAAVTDAAVVASFSNGEQTVTLSHVNYGIYSGVWRPVRQTDAITVMLVATAGTLPTVEVLRQGRVDAGTAAMVYPGGVVNAASYARGAVAPGSFISVFGQNIAAGSQGASSVPLPKTLAGASVQIGGVDVPLFYSSTGQINAQVPFELQPGTRPQVVVKVGSQVTVPETITIAPGRPGIFSRNMDGQGQGMITDAITYAMFDATNPAKAGDYAAIYCTGLGQTDLAVPSGERAPLDKVANTIVPVQVTIGGQPANVTFAGLAPGWVGLYQVNVQVPSGVTPGSAVPVVITQNGISSNTVTLAVR